MIKNAQTKICRIMLNGTEISKVYRTKDIVYQNFVNFSLDGSSGTKTGTVSLPKGRYRICMTGGGGNGMCSRAVDRDGGTIYFGYWGSSGSAAIYGILNVTKRTVYSYSVGGIAADTTFGSLKCGAGITATNSNTSGSVAPAAYPLDGGVVSGQSILESYVIASNGNKGAAACSWNGASPTGGASLLNYAGSGEYPAINYSWGKGRDYAVANATAGFLSVVKIS